MKTKVIMWTGFALAVAGAYSLYRAYKLNQAANTVNAGGFEVPIN